MVYISKVKFEKCIINDSILTLAGVLEKKHF